MFDTKHILGAIAVFAGVALILSLSLAWPSYRQVHAIHRDIADLRGRTMMLDVRTAEVERLQMMVEEQQRKVREELKIISDSPDLADLIRRLSLTVDQDTVVDQTFTAGNPFAITLPGAEDEDGKDAGKSSGGQPMAMPVTIELAGTFESLFAVMRTAESMDRLVRIGTLRVTCERNEKNSARHQPVLSASIGLEAVFVGGRR